jgi:hypothetical protein|tara:strand:+ start:219 stop:443 length:225 start_codon:yes stop_codon:yes gene_type:complete
MNQTMRDNKGYWIGGTIVAFLGVALVRLVAPELSGGWASLVLMFGFTLVIAGITTITFGTQRNQSESFIRIDKQ